VAAGAGLPGSGRGDPARPESWINPDWWLAPGLRFSTVDVEYLD
jgi:hypothetical protein